MPEKQVWICPICSAPFEYEEELPHMNMGIIRHLYYGNHQYCPAEIGQLLGRSKQCIYKYMVRNGIPRRGPGTSGWSPRRKRLGFPCSLKMREHLQRLRERNKGSLRTAESKQKMREAWRHRSRDGDVTRAKKSRGMAMVIARGGGGLPRRARPGYYKGQYMRSQWELKLAQWLDARSIRWQHNIIIPLGASTYVADFYLPDYGLIWEVKGYFTAYSREKMRRFRALYPESKLAILTGGVLSFMGVIK